MKARGIIMLGGRGSRLKPLTEYISKHLLPVYNKPMVYYSLSSLIYTNISEILIICNKNDLNIYKKLLKPIAKKYNIKFSFEFQKKIGGGIAESLLIGAKFINSCEKIVLILGDNFFYGREFPRLLKKAMSKKNKSYVFLSPVKKAKNFGVAYLDKRKKLKKIIKNKKLELSERFAAQLKLNKLPKNSSKARIRNRCEITGRPHGVYRKLKISRIALRDMASGGKIPGIIKSSW